MTVEAMRTYISGMYPSDRWIRRVRLMEDRQVVAIYKHMKQRGQRPAKKNIHGPKVQQMTIFDFMEEKQNG